MRRRSKELVEEEDKSFLICNVHGMGRAKKLIQQLLFLQNRICRYTMSGKNKKVIVYPNLTLAERPVEQRPGHPID